jgi:hypothetical protein
VKIGLVQLAYTRYSMAHIHPKKEDMRMFVAEYSNVFILL